MRPYTIQPLRIVPYIGTKRNAWPEKIATSLYLSFEDALWDLLPRLGYKRGSKLLVPDLYCVDVVNNMRSHGYHVVYYPTERDLTADVGAIMTVVEKESPDIFIEFRPDGLRTSLLHDIERKLHPRTLIVSDRVHSLMHSDEEFIPHSDRHLYIGSFRKVSMMPGTLAVFTRSIRKPATRQRYPWGYLAKALILWALFVVQVKCAYIFSSQFMMAAAMRTLTQHDDLIGDSEISAALPHWLQWVYEYFDYEKISFAKREHIFIYLTVIQPLVNALPWLWLPHDFEESYDTLRSFPLVTTIRKGILLEKELEKQGLFRTRQLIGSPWSEKQALFFLPLGPHLTKNDVKEIVRRVEKALTTIA